ncbi:MAG: hypothetical protein R3A45_03250 [Bdellovibrionota bacterium]
MREIQRDLQNTWNTLDLLEQQIQQRQETMSFEKKENRSNP